MAIKIPGLQLEGSSEDLWPQDEDDRKKTLRWAQTAFIDGKTHRQEQEDRWMRYYRMYRSWGGKRSLNDWRSRVWMPVSFYVIETIVPRLVAQLPKITVMPVGPEDSQGAKQMEFLLDYVTSQSDLYLELVEAFKSALIYGTGILKTFYDEQYAFNIYREPVMEPMVQDIPMGELDIDGNPMTQQVVVGEQPVLDEDGQPKTEMVREPILKYAGPAAEAVDIFDFFVSPESTSMEDASYVIHRVFRTVDHIERMAKGGTYHLPDEDEWEAFVNTQEDYPASERLSEVGLGSGSGPQTAAGTKLIELREVWTDDVVITTASDSLLLRAERNPFGHAEKPFVRIVDHMPPHEFWGIGELEPLEGIQDTMNALWNSRIDNVKLVLNKMFAVSVDYLVDMKDLQIRPGGVIRLREGVPIDQAIDTIDLGEVTGSSYQEAAEMERLTEKVSGVSAYQMGTDSPALNRTATGVALISEQGNTRFAHKVRISELTGLRRLAKHFGVILQQYMPEQMAVRILGPGGTYLWQTVDAQSIEGAFDYAIEAESASQTESIRREQTLSLFDMLSALPQVNIYRLIEDVLQTFGRKDVQSYILDPQMMMMQQQMMGMGQPALPGAPPPEGEMNAPPADYSGGSAGGTEGQGPAQV